MARRRRQQAASLLRGGLNLVSLATKVTPPLTFVSALTADIAPAINAEPTLGAKIKHIANAVTGRTTGVSLFSDVPKYAMKINPGGMWNPFTQAAATMIGVGFAGSFLGKRLGIPGLSKLGQLKRLGGANIAAAMAGGLFDDTPANFKNPFATQPQNAPPTYQQSTSAGYNTKMYSYSAMPARSGGSVTKDISAGAF